MYREIIDKNYRQQIWIADEIAVCGEEKTNFYISRCGYFEGFGQFAMNYVAPYSFVYIFMNSGTAYDIDGKEYLSQRGDLLFVFAGQHKKLQESLAFPLKNYYFDLGGNGIEELLKAMGICRGKQLFHGKFDQILTSISHEFFSEFEKNQLDTMKQTLLSYRFLEIIHRELPEKKVLPNEAYEKVKLLIEKDFRYSLSVEEIADKLAISRSTVFRQFKKHYGLSPKQYLEKLRLDFAHEQLTIKNISIGEVAHNSGYNSTNHFIRMFKKRYRITPLQYQKQNCHSMEN